MYICGTPLEGVRRWNKDRMAVRSAAARIRKIHSFGRSRGNAHLRHSFRRGQEETAVRGDAGRSYSSSRMMESLMKRREGGMDRRPLRRMREPVARRRSIEVRKGCGS